MSIGTTGAIIAASAIGAGSSLASGIIGSNAAKDASQQHVNADQQAIDFQKQVWQQQQQNFAPFLQGGQTSFAALLQAMGLTPAPGSALPGQPQFGPGSLPPVPQYTQGAFKAPTLAEAEQQPGYQFSLQQGLKGISQSAAAAGGAISGGTLKAADQYANNLATTNYGNVFNQSLATYNTGLDAYKAQLAGYGTQLAGQQQQFQQLLAPIQIGTGAAQSIAQSGTSAASSIGQLLQSIGASQAAGTVGSANAIMGGIGGASNLGIQGILLNSILGKNAPGGTGGGGYFDGGIP